MRTLIKLKNIDYDGYNQVAELLFELVPQLVLNDKYLSSTKDAYFLIDDTQAIDFVANSSELEEKLKVLTTHLMEEDGVEVSFQEITPGVTPLDINYSESKSHYWGEGSASRSFILGPFDAGGDEAIKDLTKEFKEGLDQ